MEFVAVRCKQCGGNIEVENDRVTSIEIDGETLVEVTGKKFYCMHCGTLHATGERIPQSSLTVIKQHVEGDLTGTMIGAVVVGDQVAGDNIEGDKVAGDVINIKLTPGNAGVAIGRNAKTTVVKIDR